MAMVIMVQGTMSNAGKSILAAGLIRVFKQDGYRVAPFKSQNMALNSGVTADGLEMGRAQIMQAEAAGIEPSVEMNPVLLKPNSDIGSQIIVNGKAIGNMSAVDYFKYKKKLIPTIKEAFEKLSEKYDIIVIEGAGSPAEINLRENDIVNMGLAELVDAPVLLVGDIDRGGVFAQLYGTIALLTPNERERIKGMVINKFRGDAVLLKSGVDMLETRCHTPVVGIVPYADIDIDDEDSLSERLTRVNEAVLDIAVIRLNKLSNFTDMAAIEHYGVRYVSRASELGKPDIIIIPGSKNTIEDMQFMNYSGMAEAIKSLSENGTPVFGICGGYQMMGESITEGDININGLGLLPVNTVMKEEKKTVRATGKVVSGKFEGALFEGYEIHQGDTVRNGGTPFAVINGKEDGCVSGNCMGTYVHGIFDEGDFAKRFIRWLCDIKGVTEEISVVSMREYKQRQYDKLAEVVRKSVDMDKIYSIMREKKGSLEPKPVKPDEIEKRSMEIIASEMTTSPEKDVLPIIKRAIHTTADFDYEYRLVFTDKVVSVIKAAIQRGAVIVTDTNMAKTGINKKRLEQYGSEVICYMADPEVAEIAKKNGTTRAVASVDRAALLDKEVIYVVGNAPTALIRLRELMDNGSFKPVAIVGVPVGFVNVVEAKELIIEADVPSIVARGRKGGSNLAAAVMNAIIYDM